MLAGCRSNKERSLYFYMFCSIDCCFAGCSIYTLHIKESCSCVENKNLKTNQMRSALFESTQCMKQDVFDLEMLSN